MAREIHTPEKSKVPTWVWVGIGMVIFAAWINFGPAREPELTYEQQVCVGLTDLQCFEKLEVERKRREFLESDAGRSLIDASSR